MTRPEYIKCVARGAHKDLGESWCGRDVRVEWAFRGVDHAAESGLNGDRLLACRACVKAITNALKQKGASVSAKVTEMDKPR